MLPPLFAPSPEVYLGMVNASPDALVVVDSDAVIRLANAQTEAMFGVPRDELVGHSVHTLVPGLFLATGAGASLGEQAGTAAVSALAVRRDGDEFPAEISMSPVRSGDGVVTCVVIRDVSERVAFQEASERMRQELIATVSHELRTPLTSILGYTEILVDMGEPAVSGQAARLLSIVRRNAERELKLVEDMLTLAVLGGASLSVDPVPTDVGGLVRNVMAELAPLAATSAVALGREGVGSLWVTGDPERLTTVLRNLITNAVKFSGPGGRVEVHLTVDGEHGVIEVQDQGGGLAADELPHVFAPLYRTPSAVSAQVPGAGLGLPIVKGIVDAHEGEIGVESEPGLGTTVQVRLPLLRNDARGSDDPRSFVVPATTPA